jgi:adenine phosphoribosyltransferase
MDLRKYIRDIPDFPKPGILFKDITPLLAEPRALQEVIDQFAQRFPAGAVDAIGAVEARGFLFAAPLALRLRKPLFPLRKPGKLPYTTESAAYELEYGTAELHVHIDAVKPGDRVLLVDDLLATGGTMKAGCQLIEKVGARIVACAFAIELGFLHGRQRLSGHDVFSIIQF